MRSLFIALCLAGSVSSLAAADIPKVAPTDAAQQVAAGKAVLVDVREPKEWAESGVAAPAVLLPKSDFDGAQTQWKYFLAKVGDKQVIVYCRTGRRSQAVAEKLAESGLPVANAGGFSDWQKAGLPTRSVKPTASAP